MNLWFAQNEDQKRQENPHSDKSLNVVIVSFEDNCIENTGLFLSKELADSGLYTVQYFEDLNPKPFLHPTQGSFFDWIEESRKIVKKTKADILIWGSRADQKIRINFYHSEIYGRYSIPYFSMLNSLYLPLDFFLHEDFPLSARLLIDAAILSIGSEQVSTDRLNRVLEQLSQLSSPKGLDGEDMTYVLNLLALVYFHAKAKNFKAEYANMILQMMRKNFDKIAMYKNSICLGCLYLNMAQVYAKSFHSDWGNKFEQNRKAIESFRYARKYFNRYTYPFDFGFISYQISLLYFYYWKQTNDIQALRDAVFNLRETEKIYSLVNYPFFWAQIQGDLGYYLSLMGSKSRNDEILMLAIDNYRNKQKVYNRTRCPSEWSKCEESIGTILYTIGKIHNNEEYLKESIKCFSSAADVYEEQKQPSALRQMHVCMKKSEEYILLLQNK